MGTSYGTIMAHLNGVVTSTTALTVSPHFVPAMAAARALAPTLPIGVHLTFTLRGAKPILPPHLVPSLVDEEGYFRSRAEAIKRAVPDEVRIEFEAQILRFLECGLYPSHLDSHHFVQDGTPEILQVTVNLAEKYSLPLRCSLHGRAAFAAQHPQQKTPEAIFIDFYEENATLERFTAILDRIVATEGEVFEMFCHPGFIDADIQKLTDYGQWRVKELEILTSDGAKAAIAERNIILSNFGSI
jgi:Uncharacterized protein conserved in bacteria